MAARDSLDLKEVAGLLLVGRLPIADLVALGVEGVVPNEVGGLGDVLLDGPLEGAVRGRGRVRPGHD